MASNFPSLFGPRDFGGPRQSFGSDSTRHFLPETFGSTDGYYPKTSFGAEAGVGPSTALEAIVAVAALAATASAVIFVESKISKRR